MYKLVAAFLLIAAQETIQVKVSLVTVGVRVTDSRGKDIHNLKAGDFSLFDNGILQKIEFFSNEEQPITLGILLDRSFSMAHNAKIDRAKEAARALVEATHAESEFFYIAFDDHVKLAADYTTDRQKMESAIQDTAIGGGTSLYDAVIEGLALLNRAQRPRQALLVISDGADEHSTHHLAAILPVVRESQTQIYTIGYFGKEEEKLFRASGARVTMADHRMIDNPRVVLEKLALESGAESFFPKSDEELAKDVDKISNDLRAQYTVAFYPKSSGHEDQYHQLSVTVRGGRYKVRARPGYALSPSRLP